MATSSLSRREFFKATAAASVASCVACDRSVELEKKKERPNIVLVMADDLGYECIGANGGTSYETPVLDKMASRGIRFEQCYAQPLCTPSRVKLMTGIYNVRNYLDFGILAENQKTFAHLLKQAGYATCVVGKWQLGGGLQGPNHFGFDEYCLWQLNRRPGRYPNPGLEINGRQIDFSSGEYGPDLVSDYACGFMERNKKHPFMIYYPMILTHCPFEPTPGSPDWDPKSKGSETYKGNPKYFSDMVTYMDKIIGKLIGKLEQLGLRENTLILFTGDNGTDEPIVSIMDEQKVEGGKGEMTDAGTRVPLIAEWPGVIPEGKVCGDIVDFSDFLPTLCECAGVPVPQKLSIDGRSFLLQLKGEKGHPREWIYCWFSRDGDSSKAKEFARNQRYKLYRTGEFYDISNDKLEKNPLDEKNLDEQAMKVRKVLKIALDQYSNARTEFLITK